MNKEYRIETDSLGEIKVEQSKLWGAQTERSLHNFKIGTEKMPIEVIKALILIKQCAAEVNMELKVLDSNIANPIIDTAKQLLSWDNCTLRKHFPLKVWQTGSGTQTNMNVNEVISNLANMNLGYKLGAKNPVHPNDHVNMSQSSNDSFPTAMHISTVIEIEKSLLPSLKLLADILEKKSLQWNDIIKIGRTHMQDATPITLGQEFSAYHIQIQHNIERLGENMKYLHQLAQGGTAVGTGINAHKNFGNIFADKISKVTGLPFVTAKNKFYVIAAKDAFVALSGILNTVAATVMKIANDIRLLGSGPRCGIGELILPVNEPGSSIMPGKVNPTQCESITMVCAHIIGNTLSSTIGGFSGHLELNTFKPLIIYNTLQSINLLSTSIKTFVEKCLINLLPNTNRIQEITSNSLMLVTALNPYIGYDNSAKIAKCAHENNISLKQAAITLNILTSEEFDKYVNLDKMV